MVEREYLTQALKDLNYAFEVGNTEIRGYGGQRTRVEIKIPTRNAGYDLGFQKAGESYELVADWFGIKDINQEKLLQQLMQRYAYHAAKKKLEAQGFSLVTEQTEQDGRIHLMLRRMV
jgi:hypothetical protein